MKYEINTVLLIVGLSTGTLCARSSSNFVFNMLLPVYLIFRVSKYGKPRRKCFSGGENRTCIIIETRAVCAFLGLVCWWEPATLCPKGRREAFFVHMRWPCVMTQYSDCRRNQSARYTFWAWQQCPALDYRQPLEYLSTIKYVTMSIPGNFVFTSYLYWFSRHYSISTGFRM